VALYFISEEIIPDSSLLFPIALMPFISFAAIRYTDRIITIAAVLCTYVILFLVLIKLGEIAKLIMPFVLMVFSASIYFQTHKIKNKSHLCYWQQCLEVVEYISLIIFYAACNYYVIRESSIFFFDMPLVDGQDIPLAFVFYSLTAAVPLLYMYFGLKQKDKTLLWSGLILVAFSAMTFKYYFSLGHPEISLTVAGVILILVAYVSIKYLKTPKHGITFEEELDENSFLRSNAEALIILEGLTQKPDINNSSENVHFGGGKSGGAGSGGSY
jgi:hypothetical protein